MFAVYAERTNHGGPEQILRPVVLRLRRLHHRLGPEDHPPRQRPGAQRQEGRRFRQPASAPAQADEIHLQSLSDGQGQEKGSCRQLLHHDRPHQNQTTQHR